MRKWTTICIFVIYGHLLVGQEILTLNDAIIIGLENNLDLKILKKNN